MGADPVLSQECFRSEFGGSRSASERFMNSPGSAQISTQGSTPDLSRKGLTEIFRLSNQIPKKKTSRKDVYAGIKEYSDKLHRCHPGSVNRTMSCGPYTIKGSNYLVSKAGRTHKITWTRMSTYSLCINRSSSQPAKIVVVTERRGLVGHRKSPFNVRIRDEIEYEVSFYDDNF